MSFPSSQSQSQSQSQQEGPPKFTQPGAAAAAAASPIAGGKGTAAAAAAKGNSRRRLAPISTGLAATAAAGAAAAAATHNNHPHHNARQGQTTSPSSSRAVSAAFSPTSTLGNSNNSNNSTANTPSTTFAGSHPPVTRQILSRHSSTSSSSSLFSPLGLSSQSVASPSSAAAAAGSGNSNSNSGRGAAGAAASAGTSRFSRQSQASLSLSTPISSSSSPSGPSGQLTSLVVTQLNILLSTLKEDKDRPKWEAQVDKIKKLVDEHGMDVSTVYLRRLLTTNASQIFPNAPRSADSNSSSSGAGAGAGGGSYPLLASEMQKLMRSPQQAYKMAEALDTTDGDLFRDFDLSTFMDHFRLDPISKTSLALACRTVSKQDLKTKADAILTSNYTTFLDTLANPTIEELPATLIANILARLLQDPPRQWNDEKKSGIYFTLNERYTKLRAPVPTEIAAVCTLMDVTANNSGLVRLLQRSGPRGTCSLEACKDMLSQAETSAIAYQHVANALLYMAIYQGPTAYDATTFVAALRQNKSGQRLDWQDVVKSFDRPELRVTKSHFLVLYNALLPVAKENEAFDIQSLWGNEWDHPDTQLSFVVAFLSCSPAEADATQIPRLRTAFSDQDFTDASDEIKDYARKAMSHPMISLDATKTLFTNIFSSQEAYNQAQSLGIPETVINANTDIFVVAASAVEKPWAPLQEMALHQLFRPFFQRNLPNFGFVLHALWKHDRTWLAGRLVAAYDNDTTVLALIFHHAQEHGWLDILLQIPNQFGLDLAAYAHSQGLIDFEQWAQPHLENAPLQLASAIGVFLRFKAEDESLVQREHQPPTTVPLKVKTVYALLHVIQLGGLDDDSQGGIQRACLQVYPRLINYGYKFDAVIDANGDNSNALSEEADAKMQEQYKMMYSNDVDPRGMIERLQRLKESEDSLDQDLFACMIHGLFDEYNCFGEYPLEALATTAVLFGGIINFGVLSSRITLGVALFMVLDAVADFTPEDSMYKFGLQALLHFMGRLEEWPTFCERLIRIPGLRGTEVYAKAEDIVRRQPHPDVAAAGLGGAALGDVEPNPLVLTNGHGEDFAPEPTYPPWQSIHVDAPLRPDIYEDPDEETTDKITFVLNNVSKRNLDEKFKELRDALRDPHHQWFASYLVEDLAKSQPNFQGLYLQVLGLFGEKVLWDEVLRATYGSVARLMNAESTLTNTTDRNNLKNLAGWLGLLTLARDKPILHRNISFKDLLIEAHQTSRLPVAIPFTCKVLTQAKDSKVFKPPQPWLMELVGLLMELYHFGDLKVLLKFEIEVLVRELGLDVKEVEALNIFRTLDLHREEELLQQQYASDGMDGFGDMHLMTLSKRAPNERFQAQDVLKSVPDLGAMLNYPPSSGTISHQQLKNIFLEAAQRAINEIITPVVERSVTIAAISTAQLVEKDFAMESDPDRLVSSAHNVVKALSGSLALVTCKEPLRMSISNNIRILAAQTLHEPLPEGSILMFVNDNLDTVCKLVEDAAENQSKAEIDAQIEENLERRRRHRQQRPDEPFNFPAVSRWAFYIPEPYRQELGGLNQQQLAIYEDFGRQMRLPSANHTNTTSQDSNRQMDVLSENYLPNLPTPAEAPALPRQAAQQRMLQGTPQSQVNGYLDSQNIGDRVIEMVNELQRVAREAPEEHIGELGPQAPVREFFEQLVRLIEASVQKDALAMHAGQRATVAVYTESKTRLEVEVLVQFLNQLCLISVPTARQLVMYLNTIDDDRTFAADVTVCLLKAGLVDLHHVDGQVAKAIAQHRTIAVEFLGALADDLLLTEHPGALRADLAMSFGALCDLAIAEPDNENAQQVMRKLAEPSPIPAGLPSPAQTDKQDQIEYIFEEWVRMQRGDLPERYIAAFIHQLHTRQVINDHEQFLVFLRTCIDLSIIWYEQEETSPFGNLDHAYIHVDAVAKLIIALVAYQSGTPADGGAVQASKAKYFEAMLCLVILVLYSHHQTRDVRFNSKCFFRLFSSMMAELSSYRAQLGDEVMGELFAVLGKTFLTLSPQFVAGFSFAWLCLIGHRMFLPGVLRGGDEKGWQIYTQLLTSTFDYLSSLITSPDIPVSASPATQDFYRGTLRLLLLLHHDFPDFLADNHVQLNAAVPEGCAQIANIVNYAQPASLQELLDPFSPGLKIERVDGARAAPPVRADLPAILSGAGIKNKVDGLVKSKSEPKDDQVNVVLSALADVADEEKVDHLVANALVLYLGSEAVATGVTTFAIENSASRLLSALINKASSPTRFALLAAVINNLRYPNAHTLYFSTALLAIFSASVAAESSKSAEEVQVQIARILIERLMVSRPHPWGVIVSVLELVKNSSFNIWELGWMKSAPEVERMFLQIAQSGGLRGESVGDRESVLGAGESPRA